MKPYWIGSDIIKKYEVYLSSLNGTKLNIFRDENKYNIRSNCIFTDAFKLKDIPKIQEGSYYYLVDKEYVEKYDDLQSKVDKVIEYINNSNLGHELTDSDSIDIQNELRDILKEEK